jgi:hypothetical protein
MSPQSLPSTGRSRRSRPDPAQRKSTSGIIQTLGGGIGAGIQLGADWLNGKVKDIPVLNIFASPVLHLVSGFGGAVGCLFNGFGNAVNHVGGAFGSLFKGDLKGFFGGMFNAGQSMIGGVVDAVGSVAKGAVNAVKSVGEGIVNTGKKVVNFFKSLF